MGDSLPIVIPQRIPTILPSASSESIPTPEPLVFRFGNVYQFDEYEALDAWTNPENALADSAYATSAFVQATTAALTAYTLVDDLAGSLAALTNDDIAGVVISGKVQFKNVDAAGNGSVSVFASSGCEIVEGVKADPSLAMIEGFAYNLPANDDNVITLGSPTTPLAAAYLKSELFGVAWTMSANLSTRCGLTDVKVTVYLK